MMAGKANQEGHFSYPSASGLGQPDGLKVSEFREAIQKMINKTINDEWDQHSLANPDIGLRND